VSESSLHLLQVGWVASRSGLLVVVGAGLLAGLRMVRQLRVDVVGGVLSFPATMGFAA